MEKSSGNPYLAYAGRLFSPELFIAFCCSSWHAPKEVSLFLLYPSFFSLVSPTQSAQWRFFQPDLMKVRFYNTNLICCAKIILCVAI